MNSENQPRQQGDTYMSIVLVLIGAIIAWSALLVGAVARVLIKRRTPDPFPYWIAAGGLGLVGAWVLFTFAHPFLICHLGDGESVVIADAGDESKRPNRVVTIVSGCVECKKVVHKRRISGTSAYRHRPRPGAAGDCD